MKKRRLLIQIGLLISLIFVIMLYLSENYILSRSQKLFLEAKNEMINKNLDSVEKSIREYSEKEFIDYIVEHADELDFDPYSEEYSDRLVELLSSNSDYKDAISKLKTLQGTDKTLFACVCRRLMVEGMGFSLNDSQCSNLACYVPLDDNHLFCLGSVYNNPFTEVTDEEYEDYYDNGFGIVSEFDWKNVPGLSAAVERKRGATVFNKFDTEGSDAVYSGFRPMFDKAGNFTCLLYVEYDWSNVYSELISNLRQKVTRDFLIAIIVAVTMILVFVYLVALRPLRKVKKTLDVYMKNKDTDEVENELVGFKCKNEVGALADGVVEFAREIEQFTADNIMLAAEESKVQTELDLASSIQREALIEDFPKHERFEVYATMTPAKAVGGDFYDVFELSDHRICFVIADVSGKGLPAALMMMAAMTSIRNLATTMNAPSEVLVKLNEKLCSRRVMDMFVTVWIGILDLKTGILTTSNAGHEYPAINSNGKYELFKDKHSLVVGGMSGVKYFDHEIQLKKGDRVFVYTDGVPEATNADVKMFGDERMIEALNIEPLAEPEKILKNVKTAVDDFVGEAEQFDDLTMMCIKYNG